MDLATIQDLGNVAAKDLQQAHILLKQEMEIITQETKRMKEKLTSSKHLSLALAKGYAVLQQQNQMHTTTVQRENLLKIRLVCNNARILRKYTLTWAHVVDPNDKKVNGLNKCEGHERNIKKMRSVNYHAPPCAWRTVVLKAKAFQAREEQGRQKQHMQRKHKRQMVVLAIPK